MKDANSWFSNSLLFWPLLKCFSEHCVLFLAESFRQEISFLSFILLWIDWAKVDMGTYFIPRHNSLEATSFCHHSVLPDQPGRVDRTLRGAGALKQPSDIIGCTSDMLWQCQLIWHPSLMVIQSCQPAQLWGNAKEGFMGCSSDFVTLIWKSRGLWNQMSQCGKREEALTYNEIGNVLPVPWSIR